MTSILSATAPTIRETRCALRGCECNRGPEQEPDFVHEGESLRRRNAAIAQLSRAQGQTPRKTKHNKAGNVSVSPKRGRPCFIPLSRMIERQPCQSPYSRSMRVDWQREAGAPSCVPPARTGSGFALSPRRFVNATGVPLLA